MSFIWRAQSSGDDEAHLYPEYVHDQFSIVMARLTGLCFALALSKYLLFQVMGQYKCNSLGISGCECLFLGACDADGKPKDSLNIAKHVPLGLELFGHVHNPLAERNLAHLCEGRTVGVLYDCTNRIPLYAATVIRGGQFSGAPGNRPTTYFKPSQSGWTNIFSNQARTTKKRHSERFVSLKGEVEMNSLTSIGTEQRTQRSPRRRKIVLVRLVT